MKALVKAHAEPGLWLDDVPEPAIGINDVLIRVRKTGICGTDVEVGEPLVPPPTPSSAASTRHPHPASRPAKPAFGRNSHRLGNGTHGRPNP
jgi:hypothetical protein